MEPESFPYQREFIDPLALWNNAQKERGASLVEYFEETNWGTMPARLQTKGWWFRCPDGQKRLFLIKSQKDSWNLMNKLTDYFSEEARMRACVYQNVSPYDFYMSHYNEIKQKALELAEANPELSYRNHLREAIWHLAKECTTFKINVSKEVFRIFKSKKVLDPSAGWLDRMLGAAAAGVEVYHGIDPNPALRRPYDEALEFIRKYPAEGTKPEEYQLITEDALVADIRGPYDTVFTSPPFFDFEIYSQDEKQSIFGRENVETWQTEFLRPYLKKAWTALAAGGHMIIYLEDTFRANKSVEEMWKYVTNELKGDFLGVIGMPGDSRKVHPLWIWRKV